MFLPGDLEKMVHNLILKVINPIFVESFPESIVEEIDYMTID